MGDAENANYRDFSKACVLDLKNVSTDCVSAENSFLT